MADGAVERIQGMILGREIAVGARMASQTEMSARLGISRATLREALSTLETLGFLSHRAGTRHLRRLRCADPLGRAQPLALQSGYSAREVFQTRLALECAIAAEAARRIDPAIVSELRAATDKMRAGWRSQDLIGVFRHDSRFHEMIVASCGNRMMRDLYDGARVMLRRPRAIRSPLHTARPRRGVVRRA